jgi:hypothetical protein
LASSISVPPAIQGVPPANITYLDKMTLLKGTNITTVMEALLSDQGQAVLSGQVSGWDISMLTDPLDFINLLKAIAPAGSPKMDDVVLSGVLANQVSTLITSSAISWATPSNNILFEIIDILGKARNQPSNSFGKLTKLTEPAIFALLNNFDPTAITTYIDDMARFNYTPIMLNELSTTQSASLDNNLIIAYFNSLGITSSGLPDPDLLQFHSLVSANTLAMVNILEDWESNKLDQRSIIGILQSMDDGDLQIIKQNNLFTMLKKLAAYIGSNPPGSTSQGSYSIEGLIKWYSSTSNTAKLDGLINGIVADSNNIELLVNNLTNERLASFVESLNSVTTNDPLAGAYVDDLISLFNTTNIANMLSNNQQRYLDYLFMPKDMAGSGMQGSVGAYNGFTDLQIEDLVKILEHIGGPISTLSTTEIPKIPYGMLVLLDKIQIVALTTEQIQAFQRHACGQTVDSRQITWFTTDQIEYFEEPRQIQAFTTCQIQSFTCKQIPWFTNAQIAKMTSYNTAPSSVSGQLVTQNQVGAFLPGQIPCFDWDQIQTWTPDQIKSLNTGAGGSQIQAFKTTQIPAFSLDQITWFNDWQIQSFLPTQVKAFSPGQVSVMSPGQVGALNIFQIHALTADMIALHYRSLTDMQLRALTDEQMNDLPGDIQDYIRGKLSQTVTEWHLYDGMLDTEERTWDAHGNLLDLIYDVLATLDVTGTLYPETDTWSAVVVMHDEGGEVLGTWDVGGQMVVTQDGEGITYIMLFDENGAGPLVLWQDMPDVMDIDWESFIDTYEIPIDNWVKENTRPELGEDALPVSDPAFGG